MTKENVKQAERGPEDDNKQAKLGTGPTDSSKHQQVAHALMSCWPQMCQDIPSEEPDTMVAAHIPG